MKVKRYLTQWLIDHPVILNRLCAYVKHHPSMVNYAPGHWFVNTLAPAVMYLRASPDVQAVYRVKYLENGKTQKHGRQ